MGYIDDDHYAESEEHKQFLKNLDNPNWWPDLNSKMKLEKAIKILDNVMSGLQDYTDHADVYTACDMAIEMFKDKERTGHWVEKNQNKDGTHNIYCSECKSYLKFKGHANSYNVRTKLRYCPHCGKRMEGLLNLGKDMSKSEE